MLIFWLVVTVSIQLFESNRHFPNIDQLIVTKYLEYDDIKLFVETTKIQILKIEAIPCIVAKRSYGFEIFSCKDRKEMEIKVKTANGNISLPLYINLKNGNFQEFDRFRTVIFNDIGQKLYDNTSKTIKPNQISFADYQTYIQCISPVSKNKEQFRYFCTEMVFDKIKIERVIKNMKDLMSNDLSFKILSYKPGDKYDIKVQRFQRSEMRFCLSSSHEVCGKIKPHNWSSSPGTFHIKEAFPLSDYEIYISINGSRMKTLIQFTTTQGSRDQNCFADCVSFSYNFVYQGVRKLQNHHCRITKGYISCSYNLCKDEITNTLCTNIVPKSSSANSVSGTWSLTNHTYTPQGYILLLYNEQGICLKSKVYYNKVLNLATKVRNFFDKCRSASVVNYAHGKYTFSGLLMTTNYIVFVMPIINSTHVGFVSKLEQSTSRDVLFIISTFIAICALILWIMIIGFFSYKKIQRKMKILDRFKSIRAKGREFLQRTELNQQVHFDPVVVSVGMVIKNQSK